MQDYFPNTGQSKATRAVVDNKEEVASSDIKYILMLHHGEGRDRCQGGCGSSRLVWSDRGLTGG